MPLSHWESRWFELQLRMQLSTRDGTGFQQLFSDLMKRRHHVDFTMVCPWGSDGDWKNDGYLTPRRQMFQCYAPRELTKARVLAKIRRDSTGAFGRWARHINEWTLVLNLMDGAPAFVLDEVLDLSTQYTPATATTWAFHELWQLVRELPAEDNVAVFGPVVADEDFASLEFRDIINVMEAVARHEPPPDSHVSVVPPGKIEANHLPSCIEDYLQLGMRRANFVDECFKRDADPLLGDRAAEAFKAKYRSLRRRRLTTEQIYDQLRIFAGGANGGRVSSRQDAAVFAVLAYFFERCDIFEAAVPRASGAA